ncbi:hypothetical protein PCANC_27513 [Puccinia coronata f. sp. avenae]|uniref:Uncharacterized protein n=1 Tax=Puccinia coronata f. sp. avenae TaxID=200324 RepID=A0A2N5TUN7_9BASI|nr:hypothetical protein PCANC_27513 [Puccinia coronata f. sp. avenae]
MGMTEPLNLFNRSPNNDINMNNQTSNGSIKQICTALQSNMNLDPNHLKIALLASKASLGYNSSASLQLFLTLSSLSSHHIRPVDIVLTLHASLVFANGAYHQLHNSTNPAQTITYTFDDRFKDFVRLSAWMILFKPNLEAYSNNPHKNGALPKTLYYLTLDAVDKQSDKWKEDHLQHGQLQEDPEALEAYRNVLLANILKTKRITINGAVPNCKEMLTAIYEELLPKAEKLTVAQIQHEVKKNVAM